MVTISTDSAAAVKSAQSPKRGHGKEIPIQKKETVPKDLGGAVSVPYHLENMRRERNRCPFPLMGGLEAVMEADT